MHVCIVPSQSHRTLSNNSTLSITPPSHPPPPSPPQSPPATSAPTTPTTTPPPITIPLNHS